MRFTLNWQLWVEQTALHDGGWGVVSNQLKAWIEQENQHPWARGSSPGECLQIFSAPLALLGLQVSGLPTGTAPWDLLDLSQTSHIAHLHNCTIWFLIKNLCLYIDAFHLYCSSRKTQLIYHSKCIVLLKTSIFFSSNTWSARSTYGSGW